MKNLNEFKVEQLEQRLEMTCWNYYYDYCNPEPVDCNPEPVDCEPEPVDCDPVDDNPADGGSDNSNRPGIS